MIQKMSPRVRMATRLYATGACPTKREASEAAGLHPSYFQMASNPNNPAYNPQVTTMMDEIDRALQDKTVDMASILQMLGREAVGRMRQLMDHSNAAIQFKATQDLLDRSPETSKIQKHQIASFSLDGADAKELAAALVASAKMRAGMGEEVLGDIVRVPLASDEVNHAGQRLLPTEVGQVIEAHRPSADAERSSGSTQGGSAELSDQAQSSRRSAA